MEHQRAAGPGAVQALDRVVRPWRIRVARGGEHDPDGGDGERRQPSTVQAQRPCGVQEASRGGGEEQRTERDGQSRQDDLRLRVAEPGVALEQDGTVRGQHEASVKRATERGAAAGQFGEDRAVESGDEIVRRLVREVGQGRVRAHAAGVRPGVAVPEPLVISRDRQRQRVPTVTHSDQARLASFEPLLDDDSATRGGGLDRLLRLIGRVADGDALARGEPIGLDDDPAIRGGKFACEGGGFGGRFEGSRARHRDSGGRCDLVAERLARLDLRRGGARPEDHDARRLERIRDPRGQRRLRPDHDELRGDGTGSGHHRAAVQRVHIGMAAHPRFRRHAVTAGADEHGVDAGFHAQLPRQRVLASATPHDQDARRHHEAAAAHAEIPGRRRMGRKARSMVWVRSGPTDTSTIGTPA